MKPSRSPEWTAENNLMDCMAMLAEIQDHCEVARARTFHQAPWKRTFIELTQATHGIDELRTKLSACWNQANSIAQGKDER